MTLPFHLVGGRIPLPAAALSAGSADCHPREGGDLLSNPRPNRLPDTPSPKGSAPKTPEPRAELLFQSLHDIHICGQPVYGMKF